MLAIETQSLTKDFGGGRGVFDLDLEVEQGRIHGFLGPNGAGKTTTLRLLLDFIRPTAGFARVLGRRPGDHTQHLHHHIGFVPGDLALPGNITGRRYLQDAADLHGNVDASFQHELEQRLNADLEAKIRTLSKGNRQKIALLDALQHQPRLLIMDEPTDGLDPLLRNTLAALLREHTKRGGTVFLSTHVVHEAQSLCDDITVLMDGRLRLQAKVSELLAEEPDIVKARVRDIKAAIAALQAAGATHIQYHDDWIRFAVHGPLLPVILAIARVGAKELQVQGSDLEDRFLRLYAGGRE